MIEEKYLIKLLRDLEKEESISNEMQIKVEQNRIVWKKPNLNQFYNWENILIFDVLNWYLYHTVTNI